MTALPAQTAAEESLDSLRFAEDRRRFVLTAALVVATSLSFVVSDLITSAGDPGLRVTLLTLRIVGVALAVLFILAVLRLTRPTSFARVLTLTSYIAVALALAIHAMRPADTLSPFFYDLFLLICLYSIQPTRWRTQSGAAGALTVGVFALLALHSTGTLLVERIAIVTLFLAANALGVMTGRARERAGRREEEYVEREHTAAVLLQETLVELRVLRDILPICSHCRKVRDERGAWAGLEEYVRRHTDSQFSHGICPDCAAQHFGDLVEQP